MDKLGYNSKFQRKKNIVKICSKGKKKKNHTTSDINSTMYMLARGCQTPDSSLILALGYTILQCKAVSLEKKKKSTPHMNAHRFQLRP